MLAIVTSYRGVVDGFDILDFSPRPDYNQVFLYGKNIVPRSPYVTLQLGFMSSPIDELNTVRRNRH